MICLFSVPRIVAAAVLTCACAAPMAEKSNVPGPAMSHAEESPATAAPDLVRGDLAVTPSREPIQPAPSHEQMHHSGNSSPSFSCPMHPEVRQAAPGSCPKCGMTLIPLDKAEQQTSGKSEFHDHSGDR